MKIGNIKSYSLIGTVAIAAAAGLGLKKCTDYRAEEKKQAQEAISYIQKYAPDEYEDILADIDTSYRSNPYVINKVWINSAKRIRDSLQAVQQ